MQSVRIRGYGIVSAYGVGTASLVLGLRAGRPALSAVTDTPVPALRALTVSAFPPGLFSHDQRGAVETVLAAVGEALRGAGAKAPLGDCALVCGGTNTFGNTSRTPPSRKKTSKNPSSAQANGETHPICCISAGMIMRGTNTPPMPARISTEIGPKNVACSIVRANEAIKKP